MDRKLWSKRTFNVDMAHMKPVRQRNHAPKGVEVGKIVSQAAIFMSWGPSASDKRRGKR